MGIVYQSDSFVIANKPHGWSTVPDLTQTPDLKSSLEQQLELALHPVHRIDKPAAGLVLFATTPESMSKASQWIALGDLCRTYLAITPYKVVEPDGIMTHFLQHQQNVNKTKVSNHQVPGFKPAILRYRIVESIDRYMLWELTMITGRTHQIRAQLSAQACPIRGDVKYGARRSLANRSILLFSNTLSCKEFTITAWPVDEDIWHRFNYIRDAIVQ